MENQKFKPRMKCFIECVVGDYIGTDKYPISVRINADAPKMSFTDTGLYHVAHSTPSLFTSEEVAAKLHPELIAEIEQLRIENEKNLSEIDRLTSEHNNTVQDLSAKLDLFMSKYHAISQQLDDEILRRHRAVPAEIDKATETLFSEKLEMQNEIERKNDEINTLKIEKNLLLKLLKFKKQ